MSGQPTFGLFLNMGANLGETPEAVFDLTRRQAELADSTGAHDLWVTEHHFIRFGINPSAVTTAAFLLGCTSRVRVGTAVVLSPLCNPVDLAERVALLDQFSDGRFDLGLGRGGYLREFEVLDIPTSRWDEEPEATARALVDLWSGTSAVDVEIQPAIRTRPHPPLFLATSSDKGVAFAADRGYALQHYFATPAEARVAVEAKYAEYAGSNADSTPAHLHTLIVVVTDPAASMPTVREQLKAALTESFRAGDHPTVPQAVNRHVGPDGKPMDREQMADFVANAAIVGPPAQVVDELGAFIEQTGARRLALYHEAIADPASTLTSIERFASDVAPQLAKVGPT